MTQLEFFTALANGAKWGVPASISRSGSANGGLPIDAYSIFDSKAKADLYASQDKAAVEEAGMVNNAYVGQIVTVWDEDDNVSVYYIDADKTLKPVGIVPTGDDKTIDVTADGQISLKGAAAATAGQQPRIVNKGTTEEPKLELDWYTPDTSTVDGLASAVGALKTTVDGVVAEDGSVTTEGLVHKVNALQVDSVDYGTRIAAIEADYLVADDIKDLATKTSVETVSTALGEYKTSNDAALAGVKATAEAAATKKYTDEELAKKADKSVVDAMYSNAKIDELVAGAKTYTDTEVAKKADKAAYEQTVTDLTNLTNKVNAFLDGTGAATEAIDTLQELLEYIDAHDAVELAADIEALEKKVVLGTDAEGKEYTTVKAYVEAAIEALSIGDYAKAEDLTKLAGKVATLETASATYATKTEVSNVDAKFASYTNTEALTELLAGKQDVIPAETYDTYGSAAAAEEAAKAHATGLNTAMDARVAELESNKAGYATTAQVATAKSEVIVAAAEDATKKADKALVDAKDYTAEKLKSYSTTLEMTTAIETAVSEEAATARAAEQKNASDITNLGIRVDGVAATAGQGVADAAVAKSAADAAQASADAAASVAAENAGKISEHTTKITALEAHDTAHAEAYNTLVTKVGGIETSITNLDVTKADKTSVQEVKTYADTIKASVDAVIDDLEGHSAGEGITEKIGLKDRVEALAGDIVDLDGDLSGLAETVDGISAQMATGAQLAEIQSTLEAAIAEVSGNLEQAVDAMATTGEVSALDERLTAAIEAEETARAAADEALTTAIGTEETARKAADEALAADISAEAALRKATDEALDTAIKAEETARKVADEALGVRLDTVEAFWEAAKADGTDENVIDTLKEIQEYIASDETGASAMAASIKQNADAIAHIYTPAVEGADASGVLVELVAEVDGNAQHYASAAVGTAKAYTDTQIAAFNTETIEPLADRVKDIEDTYATTENVETAKQEAVEAAQEYADGLADNYATAEQGGKADTAIQKVECEAGMGLKATPTDTGVMISWDDAVTLILCGGDASTLI